MIYLNFATAIIAVVLRTFVDWFLLPQVSSSILLPRSAGWAALSGSVYLIFRHFRNKSKLKLGVNQIRPRKIINGRFHKSSSTTSSTCGSSCCSRLYCRRSRSRSRNLLHDAVEESLQVLHPERSLSELSLLKSDCRKENSESVCSQVSAMLNTPKVADNETLKENAEQIARKYQPGRFNGIGDCDWGSLTPPSRRRVMKSRKTRSGKVYYTYV